MARTLKLYFDFMSQPSRALYIFLSINKIPFEPCPVALRKFEQKSHEYRKNVNRFGKVPCIVEQDFRLAESVAIYRYISRVYAVAPCWYSTDDTVRQAHIDEYLSWQHLNLRAEVSLYFFQVWLNPLMGKEIDSGKSKRLLKRMEDVLDFFEQELLANGVQSFLVGDEISIADLSAACEIEQAKIAGYDPCHGRPYLGAWLNAVRERTNPFYDKAHKYVYKLAPEHVPIPGRDQ